MQACMTGSGQLPGWLLTNPSAILGSKVTYSSPNPLLYLLPNPMYKKRWVAFFWGYLPSTHRTKECGHRLKGPVGLGQWLDNLGSLWLDSRSTKKETGPRHCWAYKINLGPYRTYTLWPHQHSNLTGAGLELLSLSDPPTSTASVLGLKVCAIVPSHSLLFTWSIFQL